MVPAKIKKIIVRNFKNSHREKKKKKEKRGITLAINRWKEMKKKKKKYRKRSNLNLWVCRDGQTQIYTPRTQCVTFRLQAWRWIHLDVPSRKRNTRSLRVCVSIPLLFLLWRIHTLSLSLDSCGFSRRERNAISNKAFAFSLCFLPLVEPVVCVCDAFIFLLFFFRNVTFFCWLSLLAFLELWLFWSANYSDFFLSQFDGELLFKVKLLCWYFFHELLCLNEKRELNYLQGAI